MSKRRKRYISLISRVLEDAVFDSVVLKLMQKWVNRLVRIQKLAKDFILFRRGHYLVGKTAWLEAEKRLNINPMNSAPEKVKEFLMCKLFRARSKAYLLKLTTYRAELARITALNKENLLEAETNKVAGLPFSVQIAVISLSKPVLHYYLSMEDIKLMIAQAVSRQADWGGIVKAMMPPILRASPAFRSKKLPLRGKSDSTEDLLRTLGHVKLSYTHSK